MTEQDRPSDIEAPEIEPQDRFISPDQPEDTVLAELRRGYRLHDRVLRPALVRVSKRTAPAG